MVVEVAELDGSGRVGAEVVAVLLSRVVGAVRVTPVLAGFGVRAGVMAIVPVRRP